MSKDNDKHKPVTEAELAEWKAKTDAATEGRWLWKGDELLVADDDPDSGYTYNGETTYISCSDIDPGWPSKEEAGQRLDQQEANAKFIASTREAMPRLLAEVERLKLQRDGARTLLKLARKNLKDCLGAKR